MTPIVFSRDSVKLSFATKFLHFAASIWLLVATIGQWIFAFYILSFYGKSTITGNFERWNNVLPHGYVDGDWKGNLVVGIHVLLAAILTIGGPLQIFPLTRRKMPTFHRWLGRIYVITAIIVSAAGLIMIWTRGGVGDLTQRISISIQAFYIITFSVLTFQYARNRQFDKHRAWALRLFMVTSGVWFFRIGLMFWLVVNGEPVGFDPKTFTGPFLTTLSIGVYALPVSLIILEIYLYAQRKSNNTLSFFTAAIILLFAFMIGIGVFGATMGMWLPRL